MRDRETHRAVQPWSEEATELPTGILLARFVLGPDGEEGSTVVCIAKWPPNYQVAAHSHSSDYCEILLEGTQKVGRDWFKAGDMRVASAGQVYGPLESGDEGCTVAIIFNGPGWRPIPANEGRLEGLYEPVATSTAGGSTTA